MSVFETKNQHLTAYLVYAGLVLLEVRKMGAKSLLFVLDDPNGEGSQLEKEFFSDSSITSARELLKAADEVRKEVRAFYDSTH